MKQKRSILLVDDDDAVRDVIRGILEREYIILEASNCRQVPELCKFPIDLAIIDYILPDGNGFDVLKTIREKNQMTPAIIITAHGDEELVIEAMRREVIDYIKKPIQLTYLRKRIGEIFLKQKNDRDLEPISTREEIILDSVREFIHKNYMKALSLEAISRMACMNRFKFCRAFKNRHGQTLISYVNSVRLLKAVTILETTNKNISETAYSVGYKNVSHFNRLFRAKYKVSPRDYRKQLCETRN